MVFSIVKKYTDMLTLADFKYDVILPNVTSKIDSFSHKVLYCICIVLYSINIVLYSIENVSRKDIYLSDLKSSLGILINCT